MEYANGRISAGNASLVPARRRALDTTVRTRAIDQSNLRQQRERDAATVAPDGDRPVSSPQAQLGRPMTSQQLIARLKKMNPHLHFEPSLSDSTKMGIYLVRDRQKLFLMGMEKGFMPEFSVRHARDVEMPSGSLDGNITRLQTFDRETRGWRTVLARLIRAGLIRLADVEKNFSLGRQSRNWKEITT